MIPLYESTAPFAEYKLYVHRLMDRLRAELPEEVTALRCQAGEYLELLQGQPTDLKILNSGYLRLYWRSRHLLTLEPGDLILNLPPEFSLRAEGASDIFTMPLEQVRGQLLATWVELLQAWPGLLSLLVAEVTPDQGRSSPEYRFYKPGEIIIEQDSDPDYVYSLAEGTVDVIRDQVTLAEVNSGEIFGALSILNEEKRTASVVARTHCTVLAVPANQFSFLIKTSPNLIMELMRSMANNLAAANQRILSQ